MADDQKAAPKNVKISADDASYPQYELHFVGDLVPQEPPNNDITIRGPHSFRLLPAVPNLDVKVLVSHNPADPGVPNLKITIKRPNAQ